MAIEWTDDLKTGDFIIDSEHKRLLKAANDLVDACSKGKGRDELVRATDFLSYYTKTHFSHEEELIEKNAYPEKESKLHKEWHKGYISEIEELSAKLKNEGPTVVIMAEVNNKLSILLTHIRTLDLKLAKYIQEKK